MALRQQFALYLGDNFKALDFGENERLKLNKSPETATTPQSGGALNQAQASDGGRSLNWSLQKCKR